MPFFEGARGRLHYRRWPVHPPEAREHPTALVLWLPGTGQHSGHYHRFARALGARNIEVWGLDTAGQGLSEGDPAAPGTLDELAADARLLATLMRRDSPGVPLILAGHSLGAATVLALVSGAAGTASGPTGPAPEWAGLVLTGTPKRALSGDVSLPDGLRALALHGVDDRRAPIDVVRDWTLRRQSVGLREYADAGHDLLHEPVHARVAADIAEWIQDVVAGTARASVE
ncbi:lysophospholipase [Nocardia sp. NEAU-G5]|uniref:Lysophospholipase n=1 Tax=Nocardia albiluteola TaxID=2842303 RepID=A0ABS6B0X2_9NOCA|nr:alpha/beta fold hydrolase [Nocardia albiluteola]MBU3063391.1 lysophospholipase [Nocardia albiluteola]